MGNFCYNCGQEIEGKVSYDHNGFPRCPKKCLTATCGTCGSFLKTDGEGGQPYCLSGCDGGELESQ